MAERIRKWIGMTLCLLLLCTGPLSTKVWAYGDSGGGGSDSGGADGGSNEGGGDHDRPDKDDADGGGGQSSGGGGGVGFGASPKALEAWEAAGGRKGTGKSFEQWFRDVRKKWEDQQRQRTWDATKAGWSASAWNAGTTGAEGMDKLGQASQFGLNFVPGVGKLTNIGLDAARGAAEGYSKAREQGMSQKDAMQTGTKTGIASGLFSTFMNKFGFGKGYGKAVEKSKAAKTAIQIKKANKQLGQGIKGVTVDEAIKTGVGDVHSTSVVNNSAPETRMGD